MSTPRYFLYSCTAFLLLLQGFLPPAAQAAPKASGTSAVVSEPTTDLTIWLRELCTADLTQPTDPETRQLRQFYARLAYAPVWTSDQGPTDNAQASLQLLLSAHRYGLKPAEYDAPQLQLLLDSLQLAPTAPQQRLAVEVQLTKSLIRFSEHLYGGRIEDLTLRPVQIIDENHFDAVGHVNQALQSEQFTQQILSAQPTTRSYVRLLFAWQQLLKTDTAAARKMTLPVAINLERLRWEPRPDSMYVVVNIPAYSLQVVRGPQVVRSHRVVVGKTETPTPELYSKMHFFQTAPEWRMPYSIATNEILPQLKRNPNYLSSKNFRLYNQAGDRVNAAQVKWNKVTSADFPYQIRQAPSYRNALGSVVFRFANPYDIYLHDTPTKKAFLTDYRALSHGCIRVQHAADLARFLLLRDGGKPDDKRVRQMESSIDEGDTKAFTLRAAVPLVVRYQTCDADGSKLRMLPDIYRRDALLMKAWDTGSLQLVSAAIEEE